MDSGQVTSASCPSWAFSGLFVINPGSLNFYVVAKLENFFSFNIYEYIECISVGIFFYEHFSILICLLWVWHDRLDRQCRFISTARSTAYL